LSNIDKLFINFSYEKRYLYRKNLLVFKLDNLYIN